MPNSVPTSPSPEVRSSTTNIEVPMRASVSQHAHLFVFLYLFTHPSIYLPQRKVIWKTSFQSGSWQIQKQFCETSSKPWKFTAAKQRNSVRFPEKIIRNWQYRKRSSSARRPWKMKSWVQNWWLRANALCDFYCPCEQCEQCQKLSWLSF